MDKLSRIKELIVKWNNTDKDDIYLIVDERGINLRDIDDHINILEWTDSLDVILDFLDPPRTLDTYSVQDLITALKNKNNSTAIRSGNLRLFDDYSGNYSQNISFSDKDDLIKFIRENL